MRTRSGTERDNPERVWTGCTHSGTTYDGFALGGTQAGFGTPDNENYGPLYSLVVAGTTFSLSLYALSGVFEVVPPGEIVWSATLTVGDVTTGVVGYTGLNGSLISKTFTAATTEFSVFQSTQKSTVLVDSRIGCDRD